MLQPTSILNTGTADSNSTVRRYPRTLDEAFPKTAAYGNAITHYKQDRYGWGVKISAYLTVYIVIGLFFYSYLTK
jgi:hypothetical protein